MGAKAVAAETPWPLQRLPAALLGHGHLPGLAACSLAPVFPAAAPSMLLDRVFSAGMQGHLGPQQAQAEGAAVGETQADNASAWQAEAQK